MADLPVRRDRWPERWSGGGWPSRFFDPFPDFAQLWDRMGRIFEQSLEAGPEGWRPAAETNETDDAYLVRVELPGVRREDAHVEVTDNELRVSGEVSQEERGDTLTWRSGRFSYRTSLPTDADAEHIEAKLANGVLTVRLPKSARAGTRRVEITGD